MARSEREFSGQIAFHGRNFGGSFFGKRSRNRRSDLACAEAAKEMRELARFEIAKGLRKIAEGIETKKRICRNDRDGSRKADLAGARRSRARHFDFCVGGGRSRTFRRRSRSRRHAPNGKGKTAFTKRIPRGVIYGITPFNFPLNLVAHKVAPALASGNAIIIKPSQRTPLYVPAFRRSFYGKRLAEIGAADRADGRKIYRSRSRGRARQYDLFYGQRGGRLGI